MIHVIRAMSLRVRLLAPLAAILLASTSQGQNAVPHDFQSLQSFEFTVEGIKRQALVHVPITANTQATPLVFVFHGHGGNAQQAAQSFAMARNWPEAISVYMQG